jgi:hypothetical protein
MMRNNNPNHTPLLDDAFVLGLRSNQSHYVQFLEIFGPAIMGYNEWHSISNCRSACTGSNLDFERWFTICYCVTIIGSVIGGEGRSWSFFRTSRNCFARWELFAFLFALIVFVGHRYRAHVLQRVTEMEQDDAALTRRRTA